VNLDAAPPACIAEHCTNQLRDHEQAQWICTACIRDIRRWLAELPNQMIVLRASMHREITGSPVRGGTQASAPIPPREDTLNLTGPASPGDVHDPHGDQEGPLPITATLGAWVCIILEESPNAPAPTTWTAEALALWIDAHLPFAARRQWAGELRGELWDMISLVRRITKVRPQKRPVTRPCPKCSCLTLTKEDHDLYVRCGNQVCEAVFTEAELNDDAQRRAEQAAA
jgi:hypothetical protein